MQQVHKVLATDRLDSIIVGAQLLCFCLIFFQVRAAEYDYGELSKLGPIPQPAEYVEAVESRHFQIQQKQTGKRVALAICIRAFAGQVIDCFLAIAGYEKRVCEVSFLESQAHKQNIVGIVLGQENELQVRRRRQYQNWTFCKEPGFTTAKQGSFREAVLCLAPEKLDGLISV
jgi:hypothetical protein